MGFGNQHQQVGIHCHVLTQPHVQSLLESPGSFTHVGETDHATAALERVRRTTNRRQGFDVAAVAGKHGGLLADGGQHLVRLFEEDSEQFGIDSLVARLGQFQRLRRRRRRRRLRLRQRRGRGNLGLPCLVTGNVEGHDGIRQIDERRAVHGLFAETGVLRRRHEILEEHLRFLPGQLDRRRDSGLGECFHLRRLPGVCRPALQTADKRIVVGFAILQGVDEEAEQRQLLRNRFEILRNGNVSGLCKLLDARAAALQQGNGTKVAKHGQGTGNLFDRGVERCQIVAFFRIAEEAVKRLFDLRQVVLDFTGNLTDQQFLLGAPRHFVKQRQFFIAAGRLAGDAGVKTGNHEVDLLREIRSEAAEILLGILQQQNGGSDFHRHRVIVAPRIFGEPGSQGGKPLS